MRYYPVSLNIAEKECLVIGGGAVGTRKVKTLLKCSAIVSVISETFSEAISTLADNSSVTLIQRDYTSSDLEDKFLVLCATDNTALNKRIADDAKAHGILCNIADQPDVSDFVLPSVVHRGDLTISVSTSGKSPAFSKKLRKDLEQMFGDEYAVFLELMGAIRQKLLAEKHAPDEHKHIFNSLIENGLLELTRNNDISGINLLLKKIAGNGFSYNDLMQQ